MIYGLSKENEKITAEPKSNAKCSICNSELIPKCGEIKIWHWCHKNLTECDSWSEGETPWHLGWKNILKKEYTEIKIENHRADIQNNYGLVIELQNSPINPITIKEREEFYKDMIWLFNGEIFFNNFIFKEHIRNSYNQATLTNEIIKSKKKEFYYSFRWKHPRQSLWYIKKPLFIDFGSEIFEVKNIYSNIPCGGWGLIMKKNNFINKYLNRCLKNE